MAATIKGTAVCWSVGGIAMTAGIITATNANYTQSARIQRTSEKSHIKDNGGVVKSVIFHGFIKTLSLTVIPSHATTVSGANSSADAHLPAPGTKITLTDDAGTIMDDNYNLVSCTENRTVDGVRTIDLELEAGDEGTELATDALT